LSHGVVSKLVMVHHVLIATADTENSLLHHGINAMSGKILLTVVCKAVA